MNFNFNNKQLVVLIQKKIINVMRISIVLTIVFAWNMSASVFSQVIRFERAGQTVSIKEVINVIEKQTDYTFFTMTHFWI